MRQVYNLAENAVCNAKIKKKQVTLALETKIAV